VKTATATSAGGVVLRDEDSVILIARRSPSGELQWTLPKGIVEPGETAEEAALREVREETGLEVSIAAPLGTIDYWFVWKPDDTRYHKFVHYFAMRPTGGDTADHDDEVEDVGWFSIDDALATASFANERELIARAAGFGRC
jgi:8-oxo-dGTP pyrophosphatase MutT (NUDIX family)